VLIVACRIVWTFLHVILCAAVAEKCEQRGAQAAHDLFVKAHKVAMLHWDSLQRSAYYGRKPFKVGTGIQCRTGNIHSPPACCTSVSGLSWPCVSARARTTRAGSRWAARQAWAAAAESVGIPRLVKRDTMDALIPSAAAKSFFSIETPWLNQRNH
jgi:hypothetical protein